MTFSSSYYRKAENSMVKALLDGYKKKKIPFASAYGKKKILNSVCFFLL